MCPFAVSLRYRHIIGHSSPTHENPLPGDRLFLAIDRWGCVKK